MPWAAMLHRTLGNAVCFGHEEAAQIYANEIGEDYMEFLGYNPLESSLDIYFNADYVKPEIIKKISEDLFN